MKALIIGGDRNGEWIDALDGSTGWVDIRTASTHRIRTLTWNIQNMATGEVLEAYTLHAAVHPAITQLGQGEPQVAGQMLQSIAMNEFARTHGDNQEIKHEPAAAEVPSTPAALFGPDGKPLPNGGVR